MIAATIGLTLSSIGAYYGIYFLARSPETYIYTSKQIPKSYLYEIDSLSLINENEVIKYFYSDAVLDIKEGMYFITDQSLVLYSKDWEEPKVKIAFSDIRDIQIDYSEKLFIDSYVYVQTVSGDDYSFPLSNEMKIDKKFIEYLESRTTP